jgi:hypothetical protein
MQDTGSGSLARIRLNHIAGGASMQRCLTGDHRGSVRQRWTCPDHSCKETRNSKTQGPSRTHDHRHHEAHANDRTCRRSPAAGRFDHCGWQVRSLDRGRFGAPRQSNFGEGANRILGQQSALRRSLISSSRFDPTRTIGTRSTCWGSGRDSHSMMLGNTRRIRMMIVGLNGLPVTVQRFSAFSRSAIACNVSSSSRIDWMIGPTSV